MGAIAVAGVTLYIWRAVSVKAALLFAAVTAFGIADYWLRDEQRPCAERAWFCEFMPERGTGFVGPPQFACPDDKPLKRVFASDAAEQEFRRIVTTGVCQNDAIKRVHDGWKAPYHPDYGTWWKRLMS